MNNNRILHIFSEYKSESAENMRNLFAQQTWEYQYRSGFFSKFPISDKNLPLIDFSNRKLPTIKSIIDFGIEHNNDYDYFCFSNSDICVIPSNFSASIFHIFKTHQHQHLHAYACKARIIPNIPDSFLNREEITLHPVRDYGFDMFIFSKKWWFHIRDHIPAFVPGHSRWDNVLFYLCGDSTLEPWTYLGLDQCYTIKHHSHWRSLQGEVSNEELYNRNLFTQFKENHKHRIVY